MNTRIGFWIAAAAMSVAATFPLSSSAQSIALDFDTDAGGSDIVHGQVIDSEYAGFGVDIWADNVGGGPDLAVAYDSSGQVSTNRDPDLRSPWDGGNAQATQGGNLLIIQENSTGCSTGVCTYPDDEGSRPAGSLYLDFNQDITGISFDLIDVEQPENTGAHLALLDADRNVIGGSQIMFDSLTSTAGAVSWGNNFYNAISQIVFNIGQQVQGVMFNLGGSGAINNVVAYHSVPEIDAAKGSIAFALLLGIVAMIRERRRPLLAV